MITEEKQLLLKDLCGRLPYGVKGLYQWKGNASFDRELNGDLYNELSLSWGSTCDSEFTPYLRPMSSMTEVEREELKEEHKKDEKIYDEVLEKISKGDESARGTAVLHFAVDWCNENHFDYQGLIPMGLALEAPKGMYKTE